LNILQFLIIFVLIYRKDSKDSLPQVANTLDFRTIFGSVNEFIDEE